jgi:hypothetical protein
VASSPFDRGIVAITPHPFAASRGFDPRPLGREIQTLSICSRKAVQNCSLIPISCSHPDLETSTAEPCFKLKDSNPLVCGVHNVPLIEHQSSEDDVLFNVRMIHKTLSITQTMAVASQITSGATRK